MKKSPIILFRSLFFKVISSHFVLWIHNHFIYLFFSLSKSDSEGKAASEPRLSHTDPSAQRPQTCQCLVFSSFTKGVLDLQTCISGVELFRGGGSPFSGGGHWAWSAGIMGRGRGWVGLVWEAGGQTRTYSYTRRLPSTPPSL